MRRRDGARQRARGAARLRATGVALALTVALAAAAQAATASTARDWRPYPGFEVAAPVFRANGFPRYKTAAVRCYTSRGWRRATGGDNLAGFYEDGAAHVHRSTCTSAARLLERGILTEDTVYDLATLVHEAVHRQGIHDESTTECLSSWITAHIVLARGSSRKTAIRVFRMARFSSETDLPPEYFETDRDCAEVAVRYGVHPIGDPLVS